MYFVVIYTFPQDNSENQNFFLYHVMKQTTNKNYTIEQIDLRHVPRVIHIKFHCPGPIHVIDDIPGMGYKNVNARVFEYMN